MQNSSKQWNGKEGNQESALGLSRTETMVTIQTDSQSREHNNAQYCSRQYARCAIETFPQGLINNSHYQSARAMKCVENVAGETRLQPSENCMAVINDKQENAADNQSKISTKMVYRNGTETYCLKQLDGEGMLQSVGYGVRAQQIWGYSKQLQLRVQNLEEQLRQIRHIICTQMEGQGNQCQYDQKFMPILQLAEYSHICQEAINAILGISKQLINSACDLHVRLSGKDFQNKSTQGYMKIDEDKDGDRVIKMQNSIKTQPVVLIYEVPIELNVDSGLQTIYSKWPSTVAQSSEVDQLKVQNKHLNDQLQQLKLELAAHLEQLRQYPIPLCSNSLAQTHNLIYEVPVEMHLLQPPNVNFSNHSYQQRIHEQDQDEDGQSVLPTHDPINVVPNQEMMNNGEEVSERGLITQVRTSLKDVVVSERHRLGSVESPCRQQSITEELSLLESDRKPINITFNQYQDSEVMQQSPHVVINHLYEIPIELCISSKLETHQIGLQATSDLEQDFVGYNRKESSRQDKLHIISCTTQYTHDYFQSYKHSNQHQQPLIQEWGRRNKKRERNYLIQDYVVEAKQTQGLPQSQDYKVNHTPHSIEDYRQSHGQESGQQIEEDAVACATKQMFMLLQSQEEQPQRGELCAIKALKTANKDENVQITYKYTYKDNKELAQQAEQEPEPLGHQPQFNKIAEPIVQNRGQKVFTTCKSIHEQDLQTPQTHGNLLEQPLSSTHVNQPGTRIQTQMQTQTTTYTLPSNQLTIESHPGGTISSDNNNLSPAQGGLGLSNHRRRKSSHNTSNNEEQEYSYPYTYEHDNSNLLQPSLNIHGISVIKKQGDNSQSQSQSQIHDYYLQVQQMHEEHIDQEDEDQQASDQDLSPPHSNLRLKHLGMVKNKNKNRSMGSGQQWHLHNDLYINGIIEQRCNSQQSKSRRTTLKNINPDEPDHEQDEQILGHPIPKAHGRQEKHHRDYINKLGYEHYAQTNLLMPVTYYQQPNTNTYNRELDLGANLFLQKSLILETNTIQQADKKKAKQRLSEHPYLNFYEASEVDQMSNLKGESVIQSDRGGDESGKSLDGNGPKQDGNIIPIEVSQQPNREIIDNTVVNKSNSFFRQSILINMQNLSNIMKSSKQSFNHNQNIWGDHKADSKDFPQNNILKNAHNQVYIIDGETSSEGSRANREMRISSIKQEMSHMNISDNEFDHIQTLIKAPSKKGEIISKFNINHLNSRNMKVQGMQHGQNQKSSPQNYKYIKQANVDIASYHQLRQKKSSLEEQKAHLIQKLTEAELKIDLLKKQTIVQQQTIASIEINYKHKLSQIVEQITDSDLKLQTLELQLQDRTKNYEDLLNRNAQKDRQIEQNQQFKRAKCKDFEIIKSQLKQLEYIYEQLGKSTSNELQQKDATIEQLKCQYENLKEEYENFSNTIMVEMKARENRIQQYSKEIFEKNQQIESLKHDYNQIMTSLETACKEREEYMNQINSNANIAQHLQNQWLVLRDQDNVQKVYEGEFEKNKQSYLKQLENKTRSILQLEIQNLSLTKELTIAQQTKELLEGRLTEREQSICRLEAQIKQKNSIEVDKKIEGELDYLRKEIVSLSKQVEYKQHTIANLQKQVRSLETRVKDIPIVPQLNLDQIANQHNAQFVEESYRVSKPQNRIFVDKEEQRPSVRAIVFPSTLQTTQSIITQTSHTLPPPLISQASELEQNKNIQTRISELTTKMEENQAFITELKEIIGNYEQILLNNQKIIKDLQDQLISYMSDAIEKERENEILYEDIANYEAQINQILLQKIGVEIQNKRMKKMIAASERRISAIGTRLIHAAKDKLKTTDQLPTYEQSVNAGSFNKRINAHQQISQNSTLKLRELRIQ